MEDLYGRINGDRQWLGNRFSRGGGPLCEVLPGLIGWLRDNGYAVTTSRNIVRAALRLGEWMVDEGLLLEDLDVELIAYLIKQDNVRVPSHRVSNESLSAVVRFFLSVGLVEDSKGCEDALSAADMVLAQWCSSLSAQGRGDSWLHKARAWVGPFLHSFMDGEGELRWEKMDAVAANDYVSGFQLEYSASSCQCLTALLRSFLSWAYVEGFASRDESVGVLSVRRCSSGLPRGVAQRDVEVLKDSIDTSYEAGKRDFAIIVALSRLGLRAGELAALRLEDIDWQQSLLTVTGKGDRTLTLPLPVDVGEAIVDYLQHRRPQDAHRHVFCRVLAPKGPLSRAGVTDVVTSRARAAGLSGIYAHRLRHTAAAEILTRGGTLEEVRQLLGHRQQATSLSYARIDVEPLRLLAPVWGMLP